MYNHKAETPLAPPPHGIPACTSGRFNLQTLGAAAGMLRWGWGSATCSGVTMQLLLRVPASPLSHTPRGRASGCIPLIFRDHLSPLSNACPHLYLLAVWLWVNYTLLQCLSFHISERGGAPVSASYIQVAPGSSRLGTSWTLNTCSLELSKGCKEGVEWALTSLEGDIL